MVKDEAGFILLGFEFSEFEGKNCQLNIGYNGKKKKGPRDQKFKQIFNYLRRSR
jgi:hypothetical protein